MLSFRRNSLKFQMEPRAKILLLIPNLDGGGAQRFFSVLLQHLDRMRFEPHLALFRAEGEYMSEIPADVIVHDLKCRRARWSLLAIARLIRGLRPRAVLSTLPECNLALVISKPLLPRDTQLILSEACDPTGWLREKRSTAFFWRLLYRLFYRRADKIVCLSLSMIDEMVNEFNVPVGKLLRIYYPVDFRRIRKLGSEGTDPFGADLGPRVIAVGRLCNQKAFDVLLTAMQIVRHAFEGTRLAILGQGPLEEQLRLLACLMGLNDVVHFHGFQQNPWVFINHADVFVLPSRYEGLPNVLLEAMALNKPIVAADSSGGVRELKSYIPDMILVPPDDPAALAEGIIKACKTCRVERAGSPELRARLSVEHVVGEYSDLFLS